MCKQTGPMRCDVRATGGSPEELCAQLRACLPGRGEPLMDGTVTTVERCEALTHVTKARPETGFDSFGIVKVFGTLNGDLSGSGEYLVAERGGKYCVVDDALVLTQEQRSWHEDEIALTVDSRGRLHMQGQRIEHIELDQEEQAAGESDVSSRLCERRVYEVAGTLRAARTKSVHGECSLAEPFVSLMPADLPATCMKSEPPTPRSGTCRDRGPMACNIPPSHTAEELCAQLKRCVEEHGQREEWVLSKAFECSAPRHTVRVPVETGATSASVVEVRGEFRGAPAQAAYLVAEFKDGVCLVDQLMDPDSSGGAKSAYDLVWQPDPSPGVAVTQRHTDCERTVYSVRDGVFLRKYGITQRGSCDI